MKPIVNKSIVQNVVDRLTQAIIDGELNTGDRIPTETELAQSFSVGRNTIREAVRILVAYGVLEVRRPEGTFICDTFKPEILNPMLYSMIFSRNSSYDDLIELRKITENGIMQMLWQKGLAENEKASLLKLAQGIEEIILASPADTESIASADRQFHDALAMATGNPLVITLHKMIVQLTYASRCQTIKKIIQVGNGQYLIDTHYDLLDKLNGDSIDALFKAIQNSYFFSKDIYK